MACTPYNSAHIEDLTKKLIEVAFELTWSAYDKMDIGLELRASQLVWLPAAAVVALEGACYLNNASLADLFQPVHEQILDTFFAEAEVPEPVVREGPPRFMTEEWLNDIEKRGHDWLRKKFSTAELVQIDNDNDAEEREDDADAIEPLDVKTSPVDPVISVTAVPQVIDPIALKTEEQEAAAISLMGKLSMTPLHMHDRRFKPRSMGDTKRVNESLAVIVKAKEQPKTQSSSANRPRRRDYASVSNIKNWRKEVEMNRNSFKSEPTNPKQAVQIEEPEVFKKVFAAHQSEAREELRNVKSGQTSIVSPVQPRKVESQMRSAASVPASNDIDSAKFNHYVRPHGPSTKRVRSAVETVRLGNDATPAKHNASPRSRSMPVSQSTQSQQSTLVGSSRSSTMMNPLGASVSLDVDPVQVEKVLAQTAFQVNTLRPSVSRDKPDTSSWTQLPTETSGFAKIFKSKPDPNHIPKLWKRKTLDAYLFQVYEMTKDTELNEQYRYLHTPPVPRRNSDVPPEASIKDKPTSIEKKGRPEPTPIQHPHRSAPSPEIPLVRVSARGDSKATVEQLRQESQESSNLSLRATSGSIRGKSFSQTWQTSRKSFGRLFSTESRPRRPSYDFIDSYCEPKAETVDARTGKYLAKGRAIKRTNSMIIRGKPTWIDRSKIKRNKDLAIEAARFDSFFSFKKLATWKGSKRDDKEKSPAKALKTEVDLPCLPVLSPGFTESPTTTGFSTPSTATDSWTASFKNSPVSVPALEDLIEEHIASEMNRHTRREAMYVSTDRRVPLYL